MINKTLGHNKLGIEGNISKETYNVNKLSKDNLIYELKKGDIIQGSLFENAGELMLKMQNGTLVSAHTFKNMELGKLLSFLVVGFENDKWVLKPQSMNKPEINNIIDKIIQDLSLPDNHNMKDIIHKILSKHMTLDKESLNTLYRAQQLYDLPPEVMVNLKDSNMGINIGDMKSLADLKQIKINDAINDFLKAVDNISNIADLKSLISNIANKMDINKFTDILIKSLNKNIDANILPNMPSNMESNNVREYVEKIIADYTKDITYLVNNPNDIKKLSVQNALDEIYKYLGSNKLIKELAKSMVKAYLHLGMENIKKNPDEVRNINNLPDKLEEVYKELESNMKKQYENSSDNLKHPGNINETINSIKKYNLEGQYYCFPMLIKEETRNGELYFFKPKKRLSKDDSNIYLVLALDMPSLDKVEIHIVNKNDNVKLLVKVKSQDVKKYLEDKKGDLILMLKDSGYGVNDIEVKLLKEKDDIDIKEIKLCHLDIKA